MHVGAALRLPLLLLLGDFPTAPGARIQGDPLLPPCGTGVSPGRALGDSMHPGGASLGGTVGKGYPLARDPQGSTLGGLLIRAIH